MDFQKFRCIILNIIIQNALSFLLNYSCCLTCLRLIRDNSKNLIQHFILFVGRNSLRTRKHSVCTEPDLSRRNSNAIFSALLFREESRAMKTSMMVLSTYLFSWTPLFVHISSIVTLPDELVYSCVLSAATLNPLVYVFRNDAFRKEILRVVCSRKRLHESASTKGTTQYQHRLATAPHQPDSVSVHSFHMSSIECQHSFDSVTPPPADFVATYNPVSYAVLRDIIF